MSINLEHTIPIPYEHEAIPYSMQMHLYQKNTHPCI